MKNLYKAYLKALRKCKEYYKNPQLIFGSALFCNNFSYFFAQKNHLICCFVQIIYLKIILTRSSALRSCSLL